MTRILQEPLLTFDDVVILPQTSNTKSRGDIYKNIKGLPIILSANMTTVTDLTMARAMRAVNQIGVLPRDHQLTCKNNDDIFAISVGLDLKSTIKVPDLSTLSFNKNRWGSTYRISQTECYLVPQNLGAYPRFIFLEVANAANTNVLEAFQELLEKIAFHDPNSNVKIVVGNFGTGDSLLPYISFLEKRRDLAYRVYGFKVGLGPGSACTTRTMTGVGVPQFSAILNCSEALSRYVHFAKYKLIADGGIRQPADFCKAIGAGADHVMMGRVLAEASESPGWQHPAPSILSINWTKQMSGSASFKDEFTEGISFTIKRDKEPESVANIIRRYMEGLASAMSYSGGATTIQQFQRDCIFARVTHANLAESHPRPE